MTYKGDNNIKLNSDINKGTIATLCLIFFLMLFTLFNSIYEKYFTTINNIVISF